MESDIFKKKREVTFIILTAIVLSFLVGLISNIVFDAYYKNNPVPFTITTVFFVITLSIYLYVFVISDRFKTVLNTKFVFTFNRKEKAFVDLPYHPPSVNSRVYFENLPAEYKSYLYTFDNLKFFGSDFNEFIDHVVQAYLLSTVIGNFHKQNTKGWQSIKFEDLTPALKRNRCLKMDYTRFSYFQICVPDFIEIETYGPSGHFIKLKTKFGHISISWKVSFGNAGTYSEPYMFMSGLMPVADYHDFTVTLETIIDHNFTKLSSEEFKRFLEWVDLFKQSLSESSWEEAEKRLPLVLIQESIRRISTTTTREP